ncbi:MAG: hypothetical protein ACRDGQ_13885 [Candidatus Limnocylindrales bacterium]
MVGIEPVEGSVEVVIRRADRTGRVEPTGLALPARLEGDRPHSLPLSAS